MALGWIVDLYERENTCLVERDQLPVFFFDDGQPCFEVWFYHQRLQRRFVMSMVANPTLEAAGVVYFSPKDTPEALAARVDIAEKGKP
jgi:hypothetical protein